MHWKQQIFLPAVSKHSNLSEKLELGRKRTGCTNGNERVQIFSISEIAWNIFMTKTKEEALGFICMYLAITQATYWCVMYTPFMDINPYSIIVCK